MPATRWGATATRRQRSDAHHGRDGRPLSLVGDFATPKVLPQNALNEIAAAAALATGELVDSNKGVLSLSEIGAVGFAAFVTTSAVAKSVDLLRMASASAAVVRRVLAGIYFRCSLERRLSLGVMSMHPTGRSSDCPSGSLTTYSP